MPATTPAATQPERIATQTEIIRMRPTQIGLYATVRAAA
jgi:hypothetical protein